MSLSDLDDSNLLCLSWNAHMENILNVFMEQLTNESLVDVTIVCEGKFIKAHKMILSACSPHLHEILTMHDVAHPIIIMNNVKYSDMKQLIEYMYCGQIKVSVADFKSVVALAQTLQVKGLTDGSNVGGRESHRMSVAREATLRGRKRRKSDDTSCDERIVPNPNRRTIPKLVDARNLENQLPVEENVFVGEPIKEIKMEPPDSDEPELKIDEDVDGSSFEEYHKWEGEKESKPDKMLLDYMRICSEQTDNAASGTPGKNVTSPPPTRLDNISCNELQNDDNSCELSKSDGNMDHMSTFQQGTNEDRIRRPPNAFMIFSNEWRKKLAKIYESESNAGISRRLGEMWNSLDQKAKDVYFNAARLADQEHKEKYPEYHYCPQKTKVRKRSQPHSKKPVQHSPVNFAKVLMTVADGSSIPVLIALNNPEEPIRKNENSRKRPKRIEDMEKKLDSGIRKRLKSD